MIFFVIELNLIIAFTNFFKNYGLFFLFPIIKEKFSVAEIVKRIFYLFSKLETVDL